MRNSFDYYKKVEKPNMYLCNPDRTPIGFVNSENRHLVLRFNDLSELTFTVPKITGTESVYERIETKRLLFVEKIGWFQITNVNNTVSGEQEEKEVTAESHQTQLKTRGFVSEERVYMFYNTNDPLDEKYDSSDAGAMPSVVGQLYQQLGIKINLQIGNIEPTQDYGEWTLIYIDPALKFSAKSYDKQYESADGVDNICRTFSENETFGYDFIVNEVESAFEVVFEFDFLYHAIKVKRLADITLPTNIYLSLDNVVESLSVTENAENIVTVLSCNGNDLDIRTVNPMGTNYIVNFDYYKKTASDDGKIQYPWMSKELVTALNKWEVEWKKWQSDDNSRVGHEEGYSTLVEKIQELYEQQSIIEGDIQYANLKLTDLQAARDLQLKNDSTANNGKGIISVEDVSVGDKSLSPNSLYKNTAFTEDAAVVAYITAPTVSDDFTFSFSGTGKSGTAKSMLLNFIGSTKGGDGHYDESSDSTAYLYFTDDSTNKSYCKILVSAEIGVVKDASGNISVSGTTEVKGVTFDVSTSTNYFKITFPNGTNTTVSKSNSYFIYNGARYKIVQSSDGIVTIYCFYVAGFRRFTTYKQLTGDNNWCNLWEKYVKFIDSENKTLDSQIKAITEKMKYISEICHIQKYIKRCGDTLYNEFSNYWVEGEYSNDNLASTDSITIAERISLAKELMKAGETELEKVSQPTFELSVSAVNFIKLLEFRPFTNELELGRVITIEKDENTHYRPALVSIEYDLDSTESFNLTFSTAGKLDETAMTFADLLNQSSSTSRTISANWSNLTDYWKNKDKITSLIVSPLDRTLRAAQANMSNQEFTVDVTGILGRKWSDDSHTDFEKEQVRIMNNTIMFTDDNWQTIRTALGKISYDENGEEKMAYGLIAEVLVGSLLLGERLNIQNSDSTISLDNNGITISKQLNDAENEVVFNASTDGNVYVKGEIHATSLLLDEGVTINFSKISEVPDFATNDELEASISELNQTFIAANGELKSEISEKYATKESVSTIQQESDNISATVTQIQKDYALKKDGTTTSFSYSLTSSGFTLSANASEIFRCDKDGIYIKGSGEFTGNIQAKSGSIGAFEITNDGLNSDYITLNSKEIRFPVQSSFNLNDEVTIYTAQSNGENTSYITTVNSCNFIIQNLSGAGIKFSKDEDEISQTITITFNGPNLNSAGEKGNALTINYSKPSADWGASYDFNYTATISAPLPYPYSKTAHVRYMYKVNEYRTKDITLYFPAFTTNISGSVNIDSYNEAQTRYNPNDSRFETGVYFSSYSRTNQATGIVTSYSSKNNSLYSLGNFVPNADGIYSLGTNSKAWGNLCLYSAPQTSSDIRLKNSVQRLPENFDAFFDGLIPSSYILNNGTSRRRHIGFIAQEVEDSLRNADINTQNFAGLCIPSNEEKYYMLRYDEFIALNTDQIQKLKKRVQYLENIIKELKGE